MYPELGFKIDGKSKALIEVKRHAGPHLDVTSSHNHETHWSQHCDLHVVFYFTLLTGFPWLVPSPRHCTILVLHWSSFFMKIWLLPVDSHFDYAAGLFSVDIDESKTIYIYDLKENIPDEHIKHLTACKSEYFTEK